MSLIKKWINKFWRETHGQEIAEAAFVLPLLFLLVFAILWFARAYSIYTTLTQAANAAAIAGAQSTCATCGNTAQDVKTNVVFPILDAAHLDRSQLTTCNIQTNVPLNLSNPVTKGTTVQLSYRFGFGLSNIVPSGLMIRAEAGALQEN